MALPDIAHWKRLSPLLDALLELDAQGRAARLTELAQQEPALADELRKLLHGEERLRDSAFLAGRASDRNDSSPGLAGMTIGGYTLEAPLGQGGSGSVWRARRSDGRFDSRVAVKLLHLSLLGMRRPNAFAARARSSPA